MAVLKEKSKFSIRGPFKGPPTLQYLGKFKAYPNKLPDILGQPSLANIIILVFRGLSNPKNLVP
jgi:hypothetical protein